MREILRGLLAVILCAAIVLGAFALAMAEGRGFGFTPANSPTPQPSPDDGQPSATPVLQTQQPSPTLLQPTACPPRKDWILYTVQSGDTLESLALASGISIQQLREANCMLVDTILLGTLLYLPPILTATPTSPGSTPSQPTATTILRTATACGRPFGWTTYRVVQGDTLSALSRAYGISVWELQLANCLPSANYIYVGQILYVPNIPTRTPIPSVTPTPTKTPMPSGTPTPSITPSVTETPTATPTETPTPEPYP